MKLRYAFLSAYGVIAIAGSSQAAFTYTALDPPDSRFTLAAGVDAGLVVGAYNEVDNHGIVHQHGFVYNGSTFTKLDVPGALHTYPTGVSGGIIVGNWDHGLNHGFIYDGATFANTTLEFPGAYSTDVEGISGGTIFGDYLDGGLVHHGFLYNGSTFTTLDAPGAPDGVGQGTFIGGVSGDTVVGWTGSGSGGHGFIYNGSTFSTLDFPLSDFTRLRGISGGIIIGDAALAGFIYDGSAFTRLRYSPEYNSTTPYGISGNTVVGTYLDEFGQTHGFIAHIPEPAGVTLMAIAGLGLLSQRRFLHASLLYTSPDRRHQECHRRQS